MSPLPKSAGSEWFDPLDGYPRPQFRRRAWTRLDGQWQFQLDPDARWRHPVQVPWSSRINVPFAPETPASGIHETGYFRACWYRRDFIPPPLPPGGRLLLHFGAVDYQATVWINGCMAAQHRGGFTPFSTDITELLLPGRPQSVEVLAHDDPLDLSKPRGKQDWKLQPHSIWYPRTSGIWQTVWLEPVPAVFISLVRWRPSLLNWDIGLEMMLNTPYAADLRLDLRLAAPDRLLSHDSYRVINGEVHRRIALSDPGIDDYRNELLWTPDHPTLIRAELKLLDNRGTLVDELHSYTALRAVETQGRHFLLNGRPLPLRMVLDQGYWPQSGLTPPDPAAPRTDVELALKMGFNGVRCHQRLPDPRYLYWADRLGLLVWLEMPSAYRFTDTSVRRLMAEWKDAIDRDFSHPCVVTWVPLNESWGVPDLVGNAAQRHYVQALYHLTKTLDPSRPVVGNDGWESLATDIIGIHDYYADPESLGRRYGGSEFSLQRFNEQERPGGRALLLDAQAHEGKPVVLSEFGGIACSRDVAGTWGYSRARDADDLARLYGRLLHRVQSIGRFAGFCYTQFADTYQEANGLLYADRTPKFSLANIASITGGSRQPS